jgi:drug/metabolite transporter (DMT)-like permease
MGGIALALAAAASWGTADFLGGFSTRKLSILTVSVVSQLAGLAFMIAVLVALGRAPVDRHVLVLGAAAGACGLVGLAALYSGLAIGPMGVVAPITALSGVVSMGVGLVRGDRPTGLQLAGIAVAIVGVVLASRSPQGRGEPVTGRAIGLAIVAAISLGILVVLLDEGGRTDPAWTATMVRVAALTLLAIGVVIRRPSFHLARVQIGTLVVVGLLDNGANLLFALASSTGQLLSVIAVLASLYPVSTVLLARGILHERLARSQIVGVVGAFAGVALLALG